MGTRAPALAAFDDFGDLVGICDDDAAGDVRRIGRAGPLDAWSIISDSRSADLMANGFGTSARNWWPWANAFHKAALRLVGSYGMSGKRSDEYLTSGKFEQAMADGSGVLVIGYPVVNDISQAFSGYTDADGNAVTLANVVDMTIARLVKYIKRAIRNGKRVVCFAETGATTLVASQVAAVHEFNRKYAKAAKAAGAVFYNPCGIVWNQTASATLIAFKTNFSGDGTHAQQAMGRAVGKDFAAKVLPLFVPAIDTAVANTSEVIANGVGQLFSNPLLTNLTGGTSGNITISSGNVPNSVAVSGSAAGLLSVAITSTANADGFGNDVTFAFTATGAVKGRIDFTIPNATNWELTDVIQTGVEYDLAAGSAAGVYLQTQLNDNTGTRDAYTLFADVQGGNTQGPAPGTAETGVVLRSLESTWNPAATAKGYLLHRLVLDFPPAGGTSTITVRRPFINRYR